MALRCTASASKRPEEVRKPQQGLAARFKLCGRKPLRGLPPSPRWTWRCALREANVRNGLGGHTRSSGTYLGPSGCANAPRNFVLLPEQRPCTDPLDKRAQPTENPPVLRHEGRRAINQHDSQGICLILL